MLGPDTLKMDVISYGTKDIVNRKKCFVYPITIVMNGSNGVLGLFLKENIKLGQARSRTGTDR